MNRQLKHEPAVREGEEGVEDAARVREAIEDAGEGTERAGGRCRILRL